MILSGEAYAHTYHDWFAYFKAEIAWIRSEVARGTAVLIHRDSSSRNAGA